MLRLATNSMAQFLVTGGAGFIGSHIAEELVRRGERVRVVDSLITGKRQNLAHLPEVEFLEGDLADLDVAREAVRGADYVLHQAAIPSVPRSVEDPVTSNRANIDASLNSPGRGPRRRRSTCRLCRLVVGIRQQRHDAQGRDDAARRRCRRMRCRSWWPSRYCQMFTALYGLETVTIRYFNVFGPRQDPSSPYSGVISLFISALCEGRRPLIYGDGEQTRDFTYVANVVDGVLRAAHAPASASGEVINVATGGRISLNQLFRTIRDLVQSDLDPVYKDPRAGDVRDSQADISKARRLLSYQPIATFEDGLARTVEWYRTTQTTMA